MTWMYSGKQAVGWLGTRQFLAFNQMGIMECRDRGYLIPLKDAKSIVIDQCYSNLDKVTDAMKEMKMLAQNRQSVLMHRDEDMLYMWLASYETKYDKVRELAPQNYGWVYNIQTNRKNDNAEKMGTTIYKMKGDGY